MPVRIAASRRDPGGFSSSAASSCSTIFANCSRPSRPVEPLRSCTTRRPAASSPWVRLPARLRMSSECKPTNQTSRSRYLAVLPRNDAMPLDTFIPDVPASRARMASSSRVANAFGPDSARCDGVARETGGTASVPGATAVGARRASPAFSADTEGSHLSNFEYSRVGSTGLAMKSFIPAASLARRSSSKASAVSARIGVNSQPGRARMVRVASNPSMWGIWISMRIRS